MTRFATILDRLRRQLGEPTHRRLPAVDELVLTVLSQNTSDINTGRAYRAMRERFPTWRSVMEAEAAELVDALRPGGLANQKAPRIQRILRELDGSEHGLDLEWLAGLEPDGALAHLTALPGVGAKTASCVLLFSFGMPVMPVDTHIHRIALRLGLIDARVSAEAAHPILTAMTPPHRMLEAHLLLIEHGRRTCKARRPLCGECVLLDLCPTGLAAAGAPT
ncbi:MAG TPA: endonuclease III [Gaiellales bacterium]|nr:endonuclease III [Gaiellales bacterium]